MQGCAAHVGLLPMARRKTFMSSPALLLIHFATLMHSSRKCAELAPRSFALLHPSCELLIIYGSSHHWLQNRGHGLPRQNACMLHGCENALTVRLQLEIMSHCNHHDHAMAMVYVRVLCFYVLGPWYVNVTFGDRNHCDETLYTLRNICFCYILA